ncbi:MAG: TIGR00725 family protein [Rubrobacteridae bacterium]|nr:TIGR00725 family protein [Rubrobacteridae bacterium]
MQIYISVIGVGVEEPSTNALAYEVGKLIAKRDAILICGGLGGVMNATAKGVADANGISVGILPGTDRVGASRYLSLAIPTGLGEGRTALVVRAGHSVIAIGSGYGTLSEIGLALKAGKTVIGLNSWELHRDNKIDKAIVVAEDAVDAVEKAFLAI